MRINQHKRIYMNEVDASPGNGAVATPAAPAEPPAEPAAPVFDPDALVSRIMGAFEEKLVAHQNATNAALRKAGVFKQEKPVEHPSPTPPQQQAPGAPTAVTGLSAQEMEARMDARLELERVIAAREAKYNLGEGASKRLRAALSGVARESLATEADSYLSDLGLVKAQTQAPIAAPAPAAPVQAKPNISDRGSAAPTDMRDSEGVLNSRPLDMTAHDVDALILKHGEQKGLQMFQERVIAALRNVRIKPPGRR